MYVRTILIIFAYIPIRRSHQLNPRALTKYKGKISFYDRMETIEYDYNLKAFYENIDTIKLGIDKLTKICQESKNSHNCNHFIRNLKTDWEKVKIDVDLLESKHRKKRAFFLPLLGSILKIAIPTIIIAALTAWIFTEYRINKLKEAGKNNSKIMQKQIELTRKNVQDQQGIVQQTKNAFESLTEKIRKQNNVEEILHIVEFALTRHFKDAEIFKNILFGHTKTSFFSIVDVKNFSARLDEINRKLQPSFCLPKLSTMELVEISNIYHEKNETHVRMMLTVPILDVKNYTLWEYIPLPYKDGQNVKIFRIDSKYVIENNDHNESKIIHGKQLEKCLKTATLTMCNSILLESTEQPDACMENLINNIYTKCENISLKIHNHFIDTSDYSIYCFIIEPVMLKIACLNDNNIFNLSESKEIFMNNHCDLYKVIGGKVDETRLFNKIDINYAYTKPNLSIYDKSTQNYYEIFMIDRFKIKLMNTENQMYELEKESEQQIKDNDSESWFPDIEKWLSTMLDNIRSYLTTTIVYWLLLPITIYIGLTLLCKRIMRTIP